MFLKIQSTMKKKLPFLWPAVRAGVIVVMHQFSRRVIRRLLRERKEIFLELGAGNVKGKNGWLTIDISRKCDIFWDLTYGIPFPDKSISRLYSSHLLEHLTFKEGQLFLDECLRVLLPGGKFSLCVPNARLFIEAYLNPGTVIEKCLKSEALDSSDFYIYKPAYNHTTAIDFINYTAYMDGKHKYMFDEENLLYILKQRGFKNVRLREFDPDLDQKKRRFESMYVEAEK